MTPYYASSGLVFVRKSWLENPLHLGDHLFGELQDSYSLLSSGTMART
jgi:hypothetical protein